MTNMNYKPPIDELVSLARFIKSMHPGLFDHIEDDVLVKAIGAWANNYGSIGLCIFLEKMFGKDPT